MSTAGVVFSEQPWWADVMFGSDPSLCSAMAVVGAARKAMVMLTPWPTLPRGTSAATPVMH